MVSTTFASPEEKITALGKAYESITEEINKLPDSDRQKGYDLLREQVSAMGFGMGFYLDGSTSVNEQRGKSWLVEQVYTLFYADQGHLERAKIHTEEKTLATQLIGDRAEVFCRIFPLSQDRSLKEDLSFSQYLAISYLHNPKPVIAGIEANLARWKGEDRLPALLILAENGDKTVQPEVDAYTSKRAKGMKIAFRAILDRGHSK